MNKKNITVVEQMQAIDTELDFLHKTVEEKRSLGLDVWETHGQIINLKTKRSELMNGGTVIPFRKR